MNPYEKKYEIDEIRPAKKYDTTKTFFIKGNMDVTFLLILLLIVLIGLVMLFSASYPSAYYYKGDSMYYLRHQFFAVLLGIGAMLFLSKINFRIMAVFAWPAYAAGIALLLFVFTQPVTKGVRRWIYLTSSVSFQPSEIAKFAIIILFARLVCTYGPRKMKTFRYGVLPFAGAAAVYLFLILKEPHISGTILLFLIAVTMMFVGGTNWKMIVIPIIVFILLGYIVVKNPEILSSISVYGSSRITTWLNPEADPHGDGFQTLQSLFAIGSGRLTGAGIGNSRQKYLYLPEPYNDFIFSVVCEELGFIGACLIIILFVLLIVRGLKIARNCPNAFGMLIATGFMVQIAIQLILNIAVVTNMIPNTGISFPFFSYGGTSMLMLLAEMGIVLSVSRCNSEEVTR